MASLRTVSPPSSVYSVVYYSGFWRKAQAGTGPLGLMIFNPVSFTIH